MATRFTDAELLAFIDEGLPADRMVAVEAELRRSSDLRQRAAALRSQREQQGHSVSEIWRRGRLSCPSRHQLGSFLLGALPDELANYIEFHVQTVGCRLCLANLDDLREAARPGPEAERRRQKFFQSSAGYVRRVEAAR
jgi:hypothetical protein